MKNSIGGLYLCKIEKNLNPDDLVSGNISSAYSDKNDVLHTFTSGYSY